MATLYARDSIDTSEWQPASNGQSCYSCRHSSNDPWVVEWIEKPMEYITCKKYKLEGGSMATKCSGWESK